MISNYILKIPSTVPSDSPHVLIDIFHFPTGASPWVPDIRPPKLSHKLYEVKPNFIPNGKFLFMIPSKQPIQHTESNKSDVLRFAVGIM